MKDVTLILSALERGDPQAAEKLLPLIYDELRKLASVRMAQEAPGQTLQATALVHEAYLRLVSSTGQDGQSWDGRGHFFAAAAEAMRRILVENARRKRRLKEITEMKGEEIRDLSVALSEPQEDLLALDEALSKLTSVDSLASQLVQMRYFAGLTLLEAADVLEISPRTVDRIWAYAKAWLRRELQQRSTLE